jgi:hypothetical protein
MEEKKVKSASMNLIESVLHWPGWRYRGWRNGFDVQVGIEWERGNRKTEGWDQRDLPEGGKRSTWKQVLCHTE